ncbi:MAG TPA: hypothetical protein VE476_02295 [Propionibacteriaceae bacterium]|nr:hypothetical protein [Propionibacteriaceae bacterium]
MGLELRTAWGEFVGPEATAAENGLMLSSGLAGLAVAPFLTAAARALPLGEALLLRILAGDLWGGVVANNTRACARWYERPGQTDADHLRFAAAHLHPLLVAGLDRRAPGARVPGLLWAGSHYGYLMLATALVRRGAGRRRRLAAVALTLAGIALDRALGPPAVAPWFGPVYYAKLLLGHAGAALWPVQPAGSTPRGSRAGSQSSSSTARSKA